MKLIVNPHKIILDKEDAVNEKEINISKCQFEFADEITDDYVKEAYFTFKGESYKKIIVNNECTIPQEVLTEEGTVELGVVAYLVDGENITRYNPSPVYFKTDIGSLKEAENSEEITPSEMEQYEQALNDGLETLDNALDDLQDKVESGYFDGEDGITPTIGDNGNWYLGEEDTGKPSRGEQGLPGETGQPGRDGAIQYDAGKNISIENNVIATNALNQTEVQQLIDASVAGLGFTPTVVQTLPVTDIDTHTIYLVPKTGETGDIYDEYLYINNNWEHVGSTSVDLSDYYTKEEIDKKIFVLVENGTSSNFNINTSSNRTVLGKIISETKKGNSPVVLLISTHSPGGSTQSTPQYLYPLIFNSDGLWAMLPPRFDLDTVYYGAYYHPVTCYYISYSATITEETITVTNISMQPNSYYVLSSTTFAYGNLKMPLGVKNTSTYTPTGDYNPATKKYVDDITGTLSNLTTTDQSNLVAAINEVASSSGGIPVLENETIQIASTNVTSNIDNGVYILKGTQTKIKYAYNNTYSPIGNENVQLTLIVTSMNSTTQVGYLFQPHSGNRCYITIFYMTGMRSIDLNKVVLADSSINLTALPTTSITPTNQYHLVNKSYVDGLVGNINTILATLTTPGGNE